MLFELVCKCCGNEFLVERLLRIGGAVCPNCGTKNSLRPQINTAEGDVAGELQFSSGELDEQSKARRDKVMAKNYQWKLADDKKSYILRKCKNKLLMTAVIPSHFKGLPVVEIAKGAFIEHENLRTAIIEEGVLRICEYAFGFCCALESVVIPDSVTSIGYQAFYNCDSLTSIEIPDSVTSIGDDAFRGCDRLTEITLPFVGARRDGRIDTYFGYIFAASSYDYIANGAPSSLKKVTITGGNIGFNAFRDCSSLTSVVIGDSVTSIGEYAFAYCRSLTSVVIPDSVTSVGEYEFAYC